jgi:hypothetical protein
MGVRTQGLALVGRLAVFIGVALCSCDAAADEAPRYPFAPVEGEVYAHAILPTFEAPFVSHFPDGLSRDYVGGIGAGLRVTLQPFSHGVLGNADDRVGFFGGAGYAYVPVYVASSPARYPDAPTPLYELDGDRHSLLFPWGARWLLPLSGGVALFFEPGALVFVRLRSLPLDPTERAVGISPTLALGVQLPVGRHAAFTLRTGYPMVLTLGASWLP